MMVKVMKRVHPTVVVYIVIASYIVDDRAFHCSEAQDRHSIDVVVSKWSFLKHPRNELIITFQGIK